MHLIGLLLELSQHVKMHIPKRTLHMLSKVINLVLDHSFEYELVHDADEYRLCSEASISVALVSSPSVVATLGGARLVDSTGLLDLAASRVDSSDFSVRKDSSTASTDPLSCPLSRAVS
eukprot:CAMPEP_0178533634 /NCGR_PEP_ID=MMETSP0696-20121128/34594_1 /TAXON_ID=265572 /ORGANISM="Extubocellulus spinifer, Strain CCMP396" /LENGTH=118 /DNA_ID=CAMNT_0020165675 /DNA_START=111 /DNA_END=467 /DNA_ORIENTATION=-